MSEFSEHPLDAASAGRLAERGLRLGLVDTSDREAFARWLQADTRGFHWARLSEDELNDQLQAMAYRRTTGVWDETAADAATPVATVNSWPAQLTVPGERSVTGWAISSVTVAPTHRRMGIARALLEAELRTANELGVPLAMLTVSESTIYGRFGFAPAAMAANWTIDTRRVSWAGPQPLGRVQLLSLEELRGQAAEILDRTRLATPGEVETWELLWDRMFALTSESKDTGKRRRAVRYDDAAGVAQGFALYEVKSDDDDFAAHRLDAHYLAAATDDAYAALWRYLLEVDLVTEVRANLRSVDEAVRWQVSDFRGVRTSAVEDHLWLRILDVPAALQARSYAVDGQFAFEVVDPLGYATGHFLLSVDGGQGTVSRLKAIAPEVPALTLSANELGALYLGGVSARTLQRAGRVVELQTGAADAVDAAFRSPAAPWLSIWF